MLRSFTVVSAIVVCAYSANAEPGEHWQVSDSTTAPWSVEVVRDVQAFAAEQQPTAILVVQDGVVAASWGDIKSKVDVRSVRKSLLSALFGIAVNKGQVKLANTLAQLKIDDVPPALSAAEKQATVRQLLMARSGV